MRQVLALLGLLLICSQAGPALAHSDPGQWLHVSITGGSYTGSSQVSPTPYAYTVPAGKHLVVKQAYALMGNETWYQNSAYPNQPAQAGGKIYINGYALTFTVKAPVLLDWHFKSGEALTFSGSYNTNGSWSCFLVDAATCECAPSSPAPSVAPSSEPSTPPPSSEPTTPPPSTETGTPGGLTPEQAEQLLLVLDQLLNVSMTIVFGVTGLRVFARVL